MSAASDYEEFAHNRTLWIQDCLSGLILDGVEPETICIKFMGEEPMVLVGGTPQCMFRRELVKG